MVYGVVGTTEANAAWPFTIIDATHIDLVGSAFVNPYSSGGEYSYGSPLHYLRASNWIMGDDPRSGAGWFTTRTIHADQRQDSPTCS